MVIHVDRKDEYLRRLRRVERQAHGLQAIVETDRYRIDILTQVAAATKALQGYSLELPEEQLGIRVVDAARRGGPGADEKVREASTAIARLVRSWPPHQNTQEGTPEVTTTTYTVTGMTCGHCVNSVSTEVSALRGVGRVDVDLATGAVAVTSEQPREPEAVRAAVEEAGYQLAA